MDRQAKGMGMIGMPMNLGGMMPGMTMARGGVRTLGPRMVQQQQGMGMDRQAISLMGRQGRPGVMKASTQQGSVVVPGQEPLTTAMLAAAPMQEQKQMLGERLSPLIRRQHADLAGKITGMLLEIDNAELLHMLEDPASLQGKVEEAVTVLQAHQVKTEASKK